MHSMLLRRRRRRNPDADGAEDPVRSAPHPTPDLDLTDPITKEVLVDPYLASDGETYSRTSLVKAMAADPWHRSPVTYEVLRRVAYYNAFVGEVLGGGGSTDCCPKVLALYPEARVAPTRPGSREVVVRMPELLSAEDTMVRRRVGLPDAAFEVRTIMVRDGAGTDWLMYPPCAADMREDVLAFAKVVGMHKVVQNPWCIGGAEVTVGGCDGASAKPLELWWLSGRGC